jgi:ribosomal protein L16 Arg81 hydroxylase
MDFSEFLTPIDNELFFQKYWEKKFLHISYKDKFKNIKTCTIDEIDSYFTSKNILPENIRIIQNGTKVSLTEYSDKVTLLNGTIIDKVNVPKVYSKYNSGATLIINAAQDLFENLSSLCRSFEGFFKFPFQANIYITPPNSQGFIKHYDTHDIFLIQIKGPKTWCLYESKIKLATYLEPNGDKHTKLLDIEINTGDVLYLPRGIVHEAFSEEKSTIHVNLVPKQIFGYNLIEKLAKQAEGEDVFFRKSIPNSFSTELEVKTYVLQFKQKLTELLNKNKIESLLKTETENFTINQNINVKGRFIDAINLENLKLDSKVKQREGIEFLEKKVPGYSIINYGINSIKIPDFIEKSIFLNKKSFEVDQIQGLISKTGKLELVKEFIKEGFLEIV